MLFKTLIGNEKNKEILNNIENPTHAYMFAGRSGIGKFLFAKEFANKFLCNSNNKPCGECKGCIQFLSGNNVDFNIIEPIEKSIKIEQIRDLLSKIYEKPIVSDKKIYIINEADKMTTQAQNSLLKILEEPPTYVILILIVENEYNILNTIKSRCLKVPFQKIQDDVLEKYLKGNLNFDNINKDMFKIYDGSIGKAISLKDKENTYVKTKRFAEDIENISRTETLKMAKEIYENKDDVREILEFINVIFYEKSIYNIKYIECINKINEVIAKLKYNCNTEMLLDNLLLDIWEELNEKHSWSKV